MVSLVGVASLLLLGQRPMHVHRRPTQTNKIPPAGGEDVFHPFPVGIVDAVDNVATGPSSLAPVPIPATRAAPAALLVLLLALPASAAAAVDLPAILSKATGKALEGGTAGASAAAVQVLSLMWLRTAMNYQYRFGTSTTEALATLWKEGGVGRLYQGLPFALVQGPLSRFGDTAANALVLSLVDSLDDSGATPVFVRTALASVGAALWRVVLLPVDTAKTVLQVEGPKGLAGLRSRVAKEGPATLYSGAVTNSLATLVGHYPWFLTYNYLSEHLPAADAWAAAEGVAQAGLLPAALAAADPRALGLARSAFIGLVASSLSDVCSNSLRVLKTSRQAAGLETSVVDIAKGIVATEGWAGLLGRGLQTRLTVNALQGMLFSVLFKYFGGK
jgi:hypothetical protein